MENLDGHSDIGQTPDSTGIEIHVEDDDAGGNNLGDDTSRVESVQPSDDKGFAVGAGGTGDQGDSTADGGTTGSETVDEQATSDETVTEVPADDYSEIVERLDVLITVDIASLVLVFALLGALCTQTLMRSLEVRH